MVPAFAHRESQVCREALDPREQLALLAHPVRKDPRDHVETEEMQGNLELKVQRAQKEPKVTPGIKETRDLKGQRAKWAQEEPKVT